jgi:undecaprenyl-diphosphatase
MLDRPLHEPRVVDRTERAASLRRRTALATAALGAATAAGLLARELDARRPARVDRRVRRAMQTPTMHRVRELLRPLFPLGLPGAFIPAAHLTARALERRGRAGGPAIVASAWLGWLGQRGFKLFYRRERPRRRGVRRRTDSYPSGHTAGITAVALSSAVVLGRRGVITRRAAWSLAVGAPLVMGAYRVIDDEHWTTDVVGGWLFGAAIALGCDALLGDAGGREIRRARVELGPARLSPRRRSSEPRDPVRAARG